MHYRGALKERQATRNESRENPIMDPDFTELHRNLLNTIKEDHRRTDVLGVVMR